MSSGETPKYRLHRPSALAVATFNGHDFYLGPWKSKASRIKYDRLVAEWLTNGRRLPGAAGETAGTTVMELVDAYMTFAESYYRKPDGTQTSEITSIVHAVQSLLALYGRKQFNLEAARAVLGHHSAAVTEIYAEMDSALAASVIAKVG